MLRKKANLVLLALVVPAVALTGCGKKAFITVAGEEISKDEFYSRLERVPVQTPQGTKLAGQYVVEQLIGERLIEQLAKKQEVTPTEEQINSKMKVINKEANNNLAALLKTQGMTNEDLKKKIASEQALINLVSKGVTVPDAEVRAAYDTELKSQTSAFKRPEQVRISAVICNTKAKAEQAYKEISSGADFGTVAVKYSDDANVKQSKGVLNWLAMADERVPAQIRKTAFALDVNKYSQPIAVDKTWVIVKADAKRKGKVTPFEDVKDLIKEQMAMRRGAQNSTFTKDLTDYTTTSEIVVNDERYKEIPANIKKQVKEQQANLALPQPGSTTKPVTNP